jgi:uncharacterized protein (TIGR00369 family)
MSRITPQQFVELTQRSLPAAVMLGAEPLEITERHARFRMPFRTDFLRPGGTVSGPTMMALADVAMYAILLAAVDNAEQAVTSNLNMNFLRRPPPGTIIAESRLLRLGRRLAFGEVEIFTEGDPDMVAHATCTYALPGAPPAAG